MNYNSQKMLKKSRFKDFIKTLNKDEYQKTIKHFDILLEENKVYEDKQNYEFLCNLFSSLSLVLMYIENGRVKEESQRIVLDAMYSFLKKKIPSMQ